MDQDFRNQADGFAGAAEPEEAAGAAPDLAARAALEAQQPIVRFCAWCKQMHIRLKALDAKDELTVSAHGETRRAYLNGRELLIGDGICEICRAREYPESMKGKKP